MTSRRFGLLVLPLVVLLSGCTAKESVRFALAILTIFAFPVVCSQAVIAGPTLFGATIQRGGLRALAIILYLISLAASVFLAVAATDEMMKLGRASRLELAGDYLLLLVPVTLGSALLGSLCDAGPPSTDLDGDPLPKRRVLTIAWAALVLSVGVGLGVYVFTAGS